MIGLFEMLVVARRVETRSSGTSCPGWRITSDGYVARCEACDKFVSLEAAVDYVWDLLRYAFGDAQVAAAARLEADCLCSYEECTLCLLRVLNPDYLVEPEDRVLD